MTTAEDGGQGGGFSPRRDVEGEEEGKLLSFPFSVHVSVYMKVKCGVVGGASWGWDRAGAAAASE